MWTPVVRAIAIAAIAASPAAQAAEFAAEISHTEAYQGFGAIDHLAVGITVPLIDAVRSTLKLERRRQQAQGPTPSTSGTFVEGIFNYDLSPSVYALTRIGVTDEKALFTDNAIYQEFGYKAGRWGAAFIDLNAGIGTRTFTTGRETFVSFGPTASWASGALWLRREQSASGGGYRHLVTLRQQVLPGWTVEAFAMDEERRKFTLPIGPGVTNTDFEGQRYALGLDYKASPALSFYGRVERISLTRVGTPGKYYAPDAVSLGLALQF